MAISPHPVGVLLMAYGSTPTLQDQDIRKYLTHILQYYRKTDPSPEEFEDLKQRFQKVGGSPLYPITESIVSALQDLLEKSHPGEFRIYLAMKHSPPFIEDGVARMAREGIRRAVALAMAPFRSRLSTDGYYRIVEKSGQRLEQPIDWLFSPDWNLHPSFLELWGQAIQESWQTKPESVVVFTNHSLPERILQWQDPYPDQFRDTAKALAEKCGLSEWSLAYQSAGGGNQDWLGPGLEQVLGEWKDKGKREFLVAPIGFLTDHLEILYDLDVQAQATASRLGIQLSRTRMPNDHPQMVSLLAQLVQETMTAVD